MEVTPATSVSRVGAVWKVASAGAITLRLTNLTPLTPVRIRASDGASKVDLPEITLTVLEAGERGTRNTGG